MNDYDFSTLNDKEFEILVAHLLSLEFKSRFERFKAGRDQGIDGRYFTDDGSQVIFQCKHWAKSGLKALLRSLTKDEKSKVIKLNPSRYLLVTSISLSASDKQKIASIFMPVAVKEADVFGKEDINDLLRKYPSVERDTYKLWLHSAQMLQFFQGSAILGRSNFTLDEIRRKNARYIKTQSHQLAREKLANSRVLLITGEPGIGKTTLAEQLCLEYVASGFKLCVASDNVTELETVYSIDSKQIFYFDDFLGSNYLLALQRNEDSHIVGFIKRIKSDKNKIFLLTSRTTVLNRGKMLTDKFENEKIDRHEFELKVDKYSEYDRALLLHGFLWFSDMERFYINEFLTDRRYRSIIKHKNFNPRLISFITDRQRIQGVPPEDYWAYVLARLNDPADVWSHAYENQIDAWSRAILWIIVLSSNTLKEDELKNAIERLRQNGVRLIGVEPYDYKRCMSLLIGSLLNRSMIDGVVFVSLFNPSIADYVLSRIAGQPDVMAAVTAALRSWKTVGRIEALYKEGILSREDFVRVIVDLAVQLVPDVSSTVERSYGVQVIATMVKNNVEAPGSLEQVIKLIRAIGCSPDGGSYLPSLAAALVFYHGQGVVAQDDIRGYFEHLNLSDFDGIELESIGPFFNHAPLDISVDVKAEYKAAIISYWQDALHEEISDREILSEYYDEDDLREATGLVEDELGRILSRYPFDFDQYDVEDILQHCDVGDLIHDNVRRSMNQYDDPSMSTARNDVSSDIDDLFNMDAPPD